MKPHVVLNVATSIDGKITTVARDLAAFGGEEDRELMEALRADADAVMIGAGTLRDEDPLLIVRSADKISGRRAAGKPDQPMAVIVSRSLNFPAGGSRFFDEPGVSRLVFCGHDTPADRVNLLRDVAEVVQIADGPNLGLVVEHLAARGVKRLLLEGGGELNFAMLAAGLIDEIYMTFCPFVFGGTAAPTSFGGAGFAAATIRPLTLVSVREGKAGRLFLKYLTHTSRDHEAGTHQDL